MNMVNYFKNMANYMHKSQILIKIEPSCSVLTGLCIYNNTRINLFKKIKKNTDNIFKNPFANRLKVIVATLCMVCMLFSGACQSDMDNNGEELSSLTGTKWKLLGIIDTRTGKLKVLKPKDCERCFKLAFDTDSTFFTSDGANDFAGTFKADYVGHNLNITLFGTALGAPGDGGLYVQSLTVIQSFSLQKNELRLYYIDPMVIENEIKKYLLFKLLEL